MFDRHAYWHDYLGTKFERPINGRTHHRVWRDMASERIHLRLYHTDVVTVHPDGTFTIRTNGWNTMTTRRFLDEHCPARVFTDKGRQYVMLTHPELTKPRVTKCRTCKGDGMGGWMHLSPKLKCYRCKGIGRVDYGSKPIHYRWHGEPLRIDQHGQPLPADQQPVTSPPKPQSAPGWQSKPPGVPVAKSNWAPVEPRNDYADSGDLLSAALPGLSDYAVCPGSTADCTYYGPRTVDVANLIIHLNDTHRWSREAIADWLDELPIDLTFPVPDTIPSTIH